MSTNMPIMTIQEIIEAAFGDEGKHFVNFKLIETVLMVLAKQLNMLNRQVLIQDNNIATDRHPNKTKLAVSEVKLRAALQKKKMNSLPSFEEHTRLKSRSQETSFSSSLSKGSSNYMLVSSIKTPAKSDEAESIADDVTQGTVVGRKSSTKVVFKSKKYFESVLDKIEEQREKVLRIIHQRADSHEEAITSPSPITSLQSTENKAYEKLFIVGRVAPGDTENFVKPGQSSSRQLYVVPQDELLTLVQSVADLQTIFHTYETPEFPNNMELMKELRSKASLTDAMSVLQISARLEATEKAIKAMIMMITQLAKSSGENLQGFEELEVHLDKYDHQPKSGRGPAEPGKSHTFNFEESARPSVHRSIASPKHPNNTDTFEQFVTHEQLNNSLQKLQDDIENTFGWAINRAQNNLTTSMAIAKRADEKTEQAMKLEAEIRALRLELQNYAGQVNALDAALSSQMVYYQEQLNQIEYHLESGLENMQDTIAVRGDTEAMSEIHAQFVNLQSDFDNTKTAQKELEQILSEMSLDILKLRREVETLRDTKSDRDEVEDALRDKAGLEDLNGMIDAKLFRAIVVDLEKRIESFYKKAHAQEVTWQKVIDDFTHQFEFKADCVDMVSLRDDINGHLEILRKKIHVMSDILGEPKAAAVTRKLERGAACLSCATPAVMSSEVSRILPAMPARGAELTQSNPGGGGDHETCYCGEPIPHQKKNITITSRSEVCTRFCGGEHTRSTFVRTRVPQELQVKTIKREVGMALGSDGKSYHVDREVPLTPCIPCNREKQSMQTTDIEESKLPTVASDNFTIPSDFKNSAVRAGTWGSASGIIGKTFSMTFHESITPVEPLVEVSSRDVSGLDFRNSAVRADTSDSASGTIGKTGSMTFHESITSEEPLVEVSSRDVTSHPVSPAVSSAGDHNTPLAPSLIDASEDVDETTSYNGIG